MTIVSAASAEASPADTETAPVAVTSMLSVAEAPKFPAVSTVIVDATISAVESLPLVTLPVNVPVNDELFPTVIEFVRVVAPA